MKKFKKIIKHQIKKTAESVNLSAVVLRLVINYIVIYNFFGSATDLKEMIRQSKQTENERKIAMQADTLNAVVLALRCRGTHHGKRMKGIAQGLLQASQTYNCFTKQEQTAISNILDRV